MPPSHCVTTSSILSLIYEGYYYHKRINTTSDILHICILLMNMTVFSHREVRFKMFSKCFFKLMYCSAPFEVSQHSIH